MTIQEQADNAEEKLLAGELVMLGDEILDELCERDWSNHIASAYNRKAVGIKDRYVAWVGDDNKPELTFDENMNVWAEVK